MNRVILRLIYGQSAVTSGWIVAPMAITAMFGKSAVIGILNRVGYRTTLMTNTFVTDVLICCMAIPGVNNEIHNAFRYTFLVVGTLTIISGFIFRRLHFKDGDNMKSDEA